jgi:hypothetical protein
MDLYVIRRPSAWANVKELEAAGAKSAKVGNDEMSDRVRWIRSYVIKEPDGRLDTVCIYQARDPESIREHARRVGMPSDQIFPVVKTIVVRADPERGKRRRLTSVRRGERLAPLESAKREEQIHEHPSSASGQLRTRLRRRQHDYHRGMEHRAVR